jgi:hypothetical protein
MLMLILYDFKCNQCSTVKEILAPRGTDKLLCDSCLGDSVRMISPVRGRCDGTDSGFPDAYDKWGRDHAKRGGDSEQTLDENHSL